MAPLILLNSQEGQRLLNEASSGGGIIQNILVKVFAKQIGEANCGLQSLAMVLSAASLGAEGKQPQDVDMTKLPYTEAGMFKLPGPLSVVGSESEVNSKGITLDQLYRVIKSLGKEVTKYHVPQDVSYEKFREMSISALESAGSSTALILNYHMATLGQNEFVGHFSPIGAYHKTSDRLLILDTWYKTVEPWATMEDVYNAMNTVDNDSGQSRGFLVVH